MARPVASGLSVDEVRRLVERRGAALGAGFLEELERDPRRGIGTIAARLRRCIALARAERSRRRRMSTLERERWAAGLRRVAGVDEVGMGPLAGPVVAAAVVFEPGRLVLEADDSKQLDAATRQALAVTIRESALAWGLGVAEVEEIDAHNVYQAGLLAMRRAVAALDPPPELVLVDARTIPELPMPQEAHVKGDARSCSIAAASILAKVHRDGLLAELGARHPGYGFEHHAGYATPEHLAALRRLGPCAAHRRSWHAMAEHGGEMSELFYALRDELRAVADPPALERWQRSVAACLASLSGAEVRRLDVLARRRMDGGVGAARRPGGRRPAATGQLSLS